jgi:hypothetical protein
MYKSYLETKIERPKYDSHTKQFVDNCQKVFVSVSANLHSGFSKKYVSKYIIFQGGFASQGVLNEDTTVWLDEGKPPLRYVFKYIKN